MTLEQKWEELANEAIADAGYWKRQAQRLRDSNLQLLKACKIALAYMEADSDDEQEVSDYAAILTAITKAEGK